MTPLLLRKWHRYPWLVGSSFFEQFSFVCKFVWYWLCRVHTPSAYSSSIELRAKLLDVCRLSVLSSVSCSSTLIGKKVPSAPDTQSLRALAGEHGALSDWNSTTRPWESAKIIPCWLVMTTAQFVLLLPCTSCRSCWTAYLMLLPSRGIKSVIVRSCILCNKIVHLYQFLKYIDYHRLPVRTLNHGSA